MILCLLWLRLRNQRQRDKTCLAGHVVDTLRGFLVILRLGPEDTLHKRLRVAIVKWKPARLNLDHDAMTRQKHVIRCRNGDAIKQRRVWRDRFRKLQTLTITTAKHVSRDH